MHSAHHLLANTHGEWVSLRIPGFAGTDLWLHPQSNISQSNGLHMMYLMLQRGSWFIVWKDVSKFRRLPIKHAMCAYLSYRIQTGGVMVANQAPLPQNLMVSAPSR